MNKSLLVVTVVSILTAATLFQAFNGKNVEVPADVVAAFAQWTIEHSRLYASPAERSLRLKNFWQNYQEIEAVNSQDLSYKFGLNEFSDMSKEEFKAKMLIADLKPEDENTEFMKPASFTEEQLQSKGQQEIVDWARDGYTSAIRSQGTCASGYAFTAAKALEYEYNIFFGSGRTQFLSPQEYIDCSYSEGNSGCRGGWPSNGWVYSNYNGLSYDSRYPYAGYEQSCRTSSPSQFRVRQWYRLSSGDADQFRAALRQQPISVGLDASNMINYRSGVFTGFCSTAETNHFMTVVGFGTYNGYNVWKLENSWGRSWGLQGYIFLRRYQGFTYQPCGMTNWGGYPQL